MRFSRREIIHLAIATSVLAIAFGGTSPEKFLIILLVLVPTFLFHEILGHKLVAQHFGCEAEFFMFVPGLIIALILGLFSNFLIVAPGYVLISSVVKRKGYYRPLTTSENGMISLAGPAVNIVVGAIMLFLLLFVDLSDFLYTLCYIIAKFSFALAFFNLLPIPPLDGYKIFRWNKAAWIVPLIFSIIGFYLFFS